MTIQTVGGVLCVAPTAILLILVLVDTWEFALTLLWFMCLIGLALFGLHLLGVLP